MSSGNSTPLDFPSCCWIQRFKPGHRVPGSLTADREQSGRELLSDRVPGAKLRRDGRQHRV